MHFCFALVASLESKGCVAIRTDIDPVEKMLTILSSPPRASRPVMASSRSLKEAGFVAPVY